MKKARYSLLTTQSALSEHRYLSFYHQTPVINDEIYDDHHDNTHNTDTGQRMYHSACQNEYYVIEGAVMCSYAGANDEWSICC